NCRSACPSRGGGPASDWRARRARCRRNSRAMRIVGKMSGYPVEPYADPFAMAGIDKGGKVFRRAEPAGRRVQAGRLIAPRSVERMLADGQKLEMGKAHVLCIGRKLFGEFAIAQPFIAVLAPPRTEMNLIDRDRRAQRVDARRRRLWMRDSAFVDDDRGRRGPDLRRKGHRI